VLLLNEIMIGIVEFDRFVVVYTYDTDVSVPSGSPKRLKRRIKIRGRKILKNIFCKTD
jgi:hypothetical protein